MSTILDVYLNTERVGSLRLDKGRRFVFQYGAHWLGRHDATPLSLGLPLRPEPYPDDLSRPFFANLLPESDLRRRIAGKLGLSERNDFALLEAVGGECAGAVSLLAEGIGLSEEGGYRALDDNALNRLISDMPSRPFLAGEEGVRLSLAGAQNKLPVYFDGSQISVPLGAAPSSHVLKPPMAHYPDSVQNEAFCMGLADRMGLSVPEVRVLKVAHPLYLIERYDRARNADGRLTRLHQEDFCQALGVSPDAKYEKEGGPGVQACFALLRDYSTQPAADLRRLLDWVAFNYLIGNADAHAKNIALMLMPLGPRLAPFYDLLCTAVYPELTSRMAMQVGGEDRPDWIMERHWRQFADATGIAFKLVRQIVFTLSQTLPAEAGDEAEGFRQKYGSCEILDPILEVVRSRCRKVSGVLGSAG